MEELADEFLEYILGESHGKFLAISVGITGISVELLKDSRGISREIARQISEQSFSSMNSWFRDFCGTV